MQEMIEKVLDVLAIVGMLMGQKQIGGWLDGARFVAVHASDFVGPFPPLPNKP
jgi:hypothetical protein